MLYIQLYNILGFAEDGYEIYTGLLHTLLHTLLFCSLNLLYGGARCRRGLHKAPYTVGRRNLKRIQLYFYG